MATRNTKKSRGKKPTKTIAKAEKKAKTKTVSKPKAKKTTLKKRVVAIKKKTMLKKKNISPVKKAAPKMVTKKEKIQAVKDICGIEKQQFDLTLEKISQLIQQRAYQLWENAGAHHGSDQDHWREAEKEILSQLLKR